MDSFHLIEKNYYININVNFNMGYEFIDDSSVTILAYDLSIKDVNLRKENAIEYKTLKIAQQKLGVGQHVMKTALKNRGRVYSTLYDKEFALRIKPIKK